MTTEINLMYICWKPINQDTFMIAWIRITSDEFIFINCCTIDDYGVTQWAETTVAKAKNFLFKPKLLKKENCKDIV